MNEDVMSLKFYSPYSSAITYSQADFTKDIHELDKQLCGVEVDLIIGIARGGCVPAVCLSHLMCVPATMIDFSRCDGINLHPSDRTPLYARIQEQFKHVLFVDEIVDGGSSMTSLLEETAPFFKAEVASLLHNVDVILPVKHYYARGFSRAEEARFFQFWWEYL